MKCQRCGNAEVRQEGRLLMPAMGADATVALWLQGVKGRVMACVCSGCALMLRRLGWKY